MYAFKKNELSEAKNEVETIKLTEGKKEKKKGSKNQTQSQ